MQGAIVYLARTKHTYSSHGHEILASYHDDCTKEVCWYCDHIRHREGTELFSEYYAN